MNKTTCRTRLVITELTGKVGLTHDPIHLEAGEPLLEEGERLNLTEAEATPGIWIVAKREFHTLPGGPDEPEVQVTLRCRRQ